MLTDQTVSEHSHPHPSSDDQSDEQCHAIIEKHDSQPDLCTIYSTAPSDSVTTTWISAEGDSYCTLEEIR